MKKRYVLLIVVLLAAVIAEGIFCIRCIREHQHAAIDEWSSDLTALAVEYAEMAKGYGGESVPVVCHYRNHSGRCPYRQRFSLYPSYQGESVADHHP